MPNQHARILGTVLDSITDFAYAFDLAGRFTYINKPLLDLWGLTLEQAVGKNFVDLKYPDDLAAKLQQQIQHVIDTKSRVVDETPYTNPAGETGYYEYIFSPVLAADGSVELVAGSTRDISDRKRAVAALRNEQARLAAVIERAPAFICTLRGPDHVFELANQRYFEIVGHRDLIGKTVRHALPEVEGQGFFELLDRVYTTGETFAGNELPAMLRRTPDGPLERRFMNLVYQPLRDTDGTVNGIFVHGVDVTDLVVARDAIRDSEASFRQLADSMPQIVFAATPDGHVDYFNRRWYEYTGVPAGEVGYESWKHIHTPDGLERVVPLWNEALRTGGQYEVEYLLRRHDGEFRWHLGRALPVRNEVGRIMRWFGTNTDIHDAKKLVDQNERLLQSEREARGAAEQANLTKDRFLATLSHELRTPLTPVAMTAASMEQDPALPAVFRDDVAMIRRNVELETQLIDDLLDLSRIMSGKMRLRAQATGLHNVIRHVLETVGAELHDKGLKVVTELKAAAHTVDADAARLQQVLWNLLKNSAKFTPAGGVVTIRTRSTASHLVIDVADTGKGISADALSRIFEPFEQGNAGVTTQYGGLGLGLAIAKAVVDMHGGTIRAASEGVGKGATFTMTLPLSRAIQPVLDGGGKPDGPVARGRSVRVLLVEDHADTAKTLTRLLRVDGMDVQWASSVRAGLQMATASAFDVIVSDLGLPDGTGHDLMRQLRGESRAVGIAMSGYGMEEDIRLSQEAGFVEHLVKPVNLAELRQAIRRATARFDASGVE